MPRDGWHTLDSVLNRVMEAFGLSDGLKEQRSLGYWEQAAGEKIAARVRAVRVQKGVLWVSTDSPHHATEVSLRKQQIMDAINEASGADVIRDIRFVGAWERRKGRER